MAQDKFNEARGVNDDPDLEIENEQGEEIGKKVEKPNNKGQQDAEGPIIEVDDDTPAQDRGRKPLNREVADPTQEELNEYGEGVQKRFNELSHARHDERRRADKFERENAELTRVIQALRNREKEKTEYISMGQKAYIEQAKKHAEYAIKTAKQQLKQAYDAGDGEAITAAQEILTQAQIDLQQANTWRPTQLQPEADTAYNPGNDAQPQRAQVDTRTQDWAADNPWFQRPGDEDMTYHAMSIHARLVREHGEDYTRTPDYFAEIDRDMRKTFPDRFTDTREQPDNPSATRRRAPSNVAAVQRDSKTPRRRIRLTQSQVDLANKLGVPLEVYAKEFALMEADNG